MVAALRAAIGVDQAIRDPRDTLDLALYTMDGRKEARLFETLDQSPDLPASVIPGLINHDMPLAAAEALKAAWLGLKPWVAAEEARLAPGREPLLRKGGYEKSGRVGNAPERTLTAEERRRVARNRAAR